MINFNVNFIRHEDIFILCIKLIKRCSFPKKFNYSKDKERNTFRLFDKL